ncbi:hypothetical protein CfE428DRAFT_4211 [Chthoniobacter flavus Ellin428]|uniref:Uncharacterized protein n=1 Tax=Chthoniobacter flavus Ellin428 TaxID=497964 RepID=B4D5M2_9BACT|nr:hypothetical protein [Chthoniobacter flavus]EDY18427.1 hypothetical protein CfE428DRAFT_4211 [Chthoniobacter flavus Ellin428]TCO90864.1 hypothetical protein EV701_10913 [Chthoniobacter flavus]
MNTPPNEPTRDDECILDDRFEDLFDQEGPTPEELRRADAQLKASAIYYKERPFPDDPDKIEKEKKARAKFEAALAAIEAQYEKEMKEKEKNG